jgi:CBS domain-containing protein
MTRRPVLVGPDEPVSAAIEAMRERGISSVLVPPPSGAIAYGILTMRDIIAKIVTHGLDPDAVRAGEITSWRLITARPLWPLREVARQMAQAHVRRLPVVDGGALQGLISDTDVFTALVPRPEWEHTRAVRKARSLRRAAQTGPARTVRDLMSAPVLTISPGATVRDAVEKMVSAGVSSLLVPDDGDPAAGIVTKRDVVTKVVAHGLDAGEATVGELVSTPVAVIGPAATIEECSSRIAAEGLRRFPVVEDGGVLGIISDSDILAAVEGHRWWGHHGRRWPSSHIVADVMRPVPEGADLDAGDAVVPELSVWECATRLAHGANRVLPVVQEGRTIGVVSGADILRALEERGGAD